MIQMNTICGNRLNQRQTGIFREVSLNREEDPEPHFHEIPLNSSILLKNWKNTSGKYTLYNNEKTIPHSALKKESYVHITSPIRRLVDLLNLIAFQHSMVLVEKVSEKAEEFLNKWKSNLQEINRQMKSIRKVQMDCDLLNRCTAHPEWMHSHSSVSSNPTHDNFASSSSVGQRKTLEHTHRGIIFDRFERPDGDYSYIVHLSDLNILGRITSQEKYVNYQLLDFKLFMFQDSDKLCRKIRLSVL
jgi:hypothetical protein